jgi:formylmethanofuran dehydrogenase subunit C
MGAAATITEVEVNGGTLEIRGDFTITTLDQRGGVVDDRHIKTGGNAITTCDLWGGTLTLQGTAEARTIGTLNYYAGTLKADGDVITLTTLNLKNLYSLSKT